MLTPFPDITFDIEDVPIRNNEPNSQTNDDEKSSLTLNNQPDKYDIPESATCVNPESKILPGEESCSDKVHPQKFDWGAINESNILTSKRIRKKSEKAKSLDPSALVALYNVFVIGKAKSVFKGILERNVERI